MKKYVVWPGHVRSENDRDIHHIGYDDLIKLYGLAPSECILGNHDYPSHLYENLIPLRPRSKGDYKIGEKS